MSTVDLARISVGDPLPTRVHTTTTTQLVRYAAAARDFSGIHFDGDYARERGFPDVIVHGFLKAGFLAELAREWAGEASWLREFGARYVGIDVVGTPIVCRGIVSAIDTRSRTVGVRLWTENRSGTTTTTASGLLQLEEAS